MELLYEIRQVHKWHKQMRAFMAYDTVHAHTAECEWIRIFHGKMVRIF